MEYSTPATSPHHMTRHCTLYNNPVNLFWGGPVIVCGRMSTVRGRMSMA